MKGLRKRKKWKKQIKSGWTTMSYYDWKIFHRLWRKTDLNTKTATVYWPRTVYNYPALKELLKEE